MKENLKRLLLALLILIFIASTQTLAADAKKAKILQSNTAHIAEIVPDQNQVYQAIMAQQAIYPNGTPWGDDKYYESRGSGEGSLGYACHAFALVLSDAAFGDYSFNKSYDLNNIRIGDILRMYRDTHAGIVIGINGDTLTIVEGNYNHTVKWGRTIQRSEVNHYFTRYHDSSEFLPKPPPVTPVTSVKLYVRSASLYTGETYDLGKECLVFPSDATNQKVTWSSSDTSIATVSQNGIVTGIAPGKVTISVKTEDGGYTDTCQFSVVEKIEPTPEIHVTGLDVDPTNVVLKVGETATIRAKVLPEDATNKKIKWSDDNTHTIEIVEQTDNYAVIKGLKAEPAILTVATDDSNYKVYCKITVVEAETQQPSQPSEEDNSSRPENTPTAPESNSQNNSSNSQAVYRLYNSSSNEHLYTTDENEDSSLIRSGWNDEGINWYAPTSSDSPVYRLYSPITGAHLYTSDTNEVSELTTRAGWSKDKDGEPMFYSGGSIPVYRLYNEGLRMHLLTTDKYEYDVLGNSGWNQEGIGFYAKSVTSNNSNSSNDSNNSSSNNDSNSPESDDSSTNKIKISPYRAELQVGQTQQFTATGADNITWRSTNPDVATVDSSGLATAISTGFCWVGAKSGDTEELAPIYVTQKSDTSRGITGINFGPRDEGIMPSISVRVSPDRLGKVKYDWYDLMTKSFDRIHMKPCVYVSNTSNPEEASDYHELSDLQSNCETLFTFLSDEPSIVSYDSSSKEFTLNGYGTAMISLGVVGDPSIISPLSTPSGYSAFIAIDVERR